MKTLVQQFLLWLAAAYCLWRPAWPSALVFFVLAAGIGAQMWIELRKEKIHDADRKNLVALIQRMDDFQVKLNSIHGQVFSKRIQSIG